MLSVHTNATVEAGVFGIDAAGLVRLFPARAVAHSCGLHRHRHQTHRSTVHHRGRVPNSQVAVAAAGSRTVGPWTLIHADLEYTNLQEGLELEEDRKDKKTRREEN